MVLTSNTVIFLCALESPWTEHSPTNNTLKKWKEKWEQGTTSSINSQIHHGVPILPPCELLPLHSAIQLQNIYACPVWERSSHAKNVDASLNDSCRCITGCLRPIYECWQSERRRQADDTRHPCHNHQPAPSRLKSRKSFLHAVQPLTQPPQTARLTLREEQRIAKQQLSKLPIPTSEQLAPGHKSEWKLWKSLNRLRTGMGRSKTNLSKWGYADTADTACKCGTSEQTMQHLLRCPLLENECSLEDLATANEKALHCARAWPNIITDVLLHLKIRRCGCNKDMVSSYIQTLVFWNCFQNASWINMSVILSCFLLAPKIKWPSWK